MRRPGTRGHREAMVLLWRHYHRSEHALASRRMWEEAAGNDDARAADMLEAMREGRRQR